MIELSKNKRRKYKTFLGIVILIFSIFGLVSIGIFYGYNIYSKVKINNDTLCPVDGPKSLTAVMLDCSDKMNVFQSEIIKQRLINIKNQLDKFELIELYVIGDNTNSIIKPSISLCNPGNGEDINSAIGNPKMVRTKWEKSFSKKLELTINSILGIEPSPISPIIETIRSISVLSFIKDDRNNIRRKLIIISDMVQNTDTLSQYNDNISFEDFHNSVDYLTTRSDLSNVDVIIYYLRRPNLINIQGKKHIEFWQKYFSSLGAVLTEIESVN